MNRAARAVCTGSIVSLLASLPTAAEGPAIENDYGRAQIGGMRGHIEWESLLHRDGLGGGGRPEKRAPGLDWQTRLS